MPWYRGRTVVVSEASGLVAFKPLAGHRFREPTGTLELYLPAATLAVAVAEDAALGFQGDFTRVNRPDEVVLAPVAAEDARAIEAVLAERLSLPRTPRAMTMAQLLSHDAVELVRVEGTYRPGHVEAANFDGVMVNRRDLDAGARYRVMGFFHPATARDASTPPAVGYSGPRLHALSLTKL